MCNLYNVGSGGNFERAKWAKAVREELARTANAALKRYNIRPTDQGVVVTSDMAPKVMRWGIPHEQHKSVTNARGENLRRVKPWRDALDAGRRCIVPVESFYEFSGPRGNKQANAFAAAAGGWLWVPGLWNESQENGLCYTMITTPPGPVVEAVHDRQVASLPETEADAWLQGAIEAAYFREPRGVELMTFKAANPLRKGAVYGPPTPEAQEAEQIELF